MEKVSGSGTTVYVYDATGEVAAEYSSPSTATTGTLYLTGDPLGSTRLVTNGTQTWYHDYLPFGEEITGLDGRGSQYGSGDGVTHKFTGKERDAETASSATQANDFFGARYYSGTQGRFTSRDPIQYSKQRILDPQQWNMYSYARGNPLRLTDPTGMYNTSCKSADITKCSADVQAFEARRQTDLKSRDKRVRDAASAYGNFNDGNNVTVKFDPKATYGKTSQDKNSNSFTVTLPSEAAGSTTATHEGSHLADDLAAMKGAAPLTHFESEIKAYQTEAATLGDTFDSPGFDTRYLRKTDNGATLDLYGPNAGLIPDADSANRQSIIEFLAANPTYSLTEQSQGGPVYVKPKK